MTKKLKFEWKTVVILGLISFIIGGVVLQTNQPQLLQVQLGDTNFNFPLDPFTLGALGLLIFYVGLLVIRRKKAD